MLDVKGSGRESEGVTLSRIAGAKYSIHFRRDASGAWSWSVYLCGKSGLRQSFLSTYPRSRMDTTRSQDVRWGVRSAGLCALGCTLMERFWFMSRLDDGRRCRWREKS